MDTIVFDIETSNFFTDPGVGWNNFGALKISVVGIYSYLEDKYFCFEESEMGKVVDMFRKAKELVGFSMNHYDIPVLSAYFGKIAPGLDLWKKDRFDIAAKMEAETGRRVSLSRLAEANLGEKKDHHGSEAITLYKEGRIEELKNYCLKDVRLTKELYDLMKRQNFLHFPDSGGELIKVNFAPRTVDAPTATLF